MDDSRPFWMRKSLAEMSAEEWDSLCDGCGKCCLIKLEDIDSGRRIETRVSCKLLDTHGCHCTRYEERSRIVPDCVVLTPATVPDLDWMPDTCAYRLIDQGRPLEWWHPLVSGSSETVHQAGISVRGQAVSEVDLESDWYETLAEDDDLLL